MERVGIQKIKLKQRQRKEKLDIYFRKKKDSLLMEMIKIVWGCKISKTLIEIGRSDLARPGLELSKLGPKIDGPKIFYQSPIFRLLKKEIKALMFWAFIGQAGYLHGQGRIDRPNWSSSASLIFDGSSV